MNTLRPPAALARAGAAVAIVAQLAGCAVATVVTPSVPDVTARAGDCRPRVIDRGGTVPADYEEVARIESHLQRNFFLGGRVTLLDAYQELQAKACQAGGDQVRVDDFVESAAAEMTHVHVWATVFRPRSGPAR